MAPNVLIHGKAASAGKIPVKVMEDGSVAGSIQGMDGMVPVVSGGITNVVAAEFTRPADTTQYAVNDAVSNSTSAPTIITFPNVARVNGGTGFITSVKLTTNNKSTTSASFRLWLFNDVVTPTNDNAAFALTYANSSKRIGFVDVTLNTEDTTSDCAVGQSLGLNMAYKCADGSKNLYGILVAKGAYTPASGQKFLPEVSAAND